MLTDAEKEDLTDINWAEALQVLNVIAKALGAIAEKKLAAPQVNVQAPSVTVKSPEINLPEPAKVTYPTLVCEVIEHFPSGRIRKFSITPKQ